MDRLRVVALFCLCSSSLLLTNKLLLTAIPLPSFVAACQFTVSASWVLLLRTLRLATVEPLAWARVRQYLLHILFFISAVYCNMRALGESNVETVIVCRACCPLFVSLLEWFVAGREIPSARSLALLCALIGGAVGYVKTDREFNLQGVAAYRWVFAYYVMICLSDTWGKRLSHLKWRSFWGPVLYSNLLSAPPMAIAAGVTGELARFSANRWGAASYLLLLLTCAQSAAISYFGWRCRSMVSATSYTVIGVANKLLTVLGNALIWDKHASSTGIAYLIGCLVAASFYREAPMRGRHTRKL
ncbi:hypothetical protein AB1Y20_006414 [Prymnesium parvum]|uniref:Sugar phosphate transporter domain-containing protein n=1 Tax=Prymnesium parvum TaxID=97485 RepID=A0AB34J2N3_PRYPA